MDLNEMSSEQPITLSKGALIYSISLFSLVLSCYLAVKISWFPGGMGMLIYFVSGVFLNRIVLRGLVEWHPVNGSIDNVFGTKMKAFLLWPLIFPMLFFKLFISKVL